MTGKIIYTVRQVWFAEPGDDCCHIRLYSTRALAEQAAATMRSEYAATSDKPVEWEESRDAEGNVHEWHDAARDYAIQITPLVLDPQP
jgi:hypothetical protein